MGVPACRRPPVKSALQRSHCCVLAGGVWAQDGFGGRGRFTPEPAVTKVAYDGRFAFVRLRYQGGFRRDPGWAHDYPRADWHFQRILSEVTLTRTFRDESNIMALDDPDLALYPVAYHVGAGILDDERGGDPGAALLPAEGRLHHLRRLPRRARLDQPAATDGGGIAGGALGAARRDPSGVPLVLRHQHAGGSGLLRRGGIPGCLRGQRSREAPAGDCQLQPRPRRAVGILGYRAGCRWTCRTRRTNTA